MSWFPATEFATALERWPQLSDDWGTADHTSYTHQLQRHLTDMRAAATRPNGVASPGAGQQKYMAAQFTRRLWSPRGFAAGPPAGSHEAAGAGRGTRGANRPACG